MHFTKIPTSQVQPVVDRFRYRENHDIICLLLSYYQWQVHTFERARSPVFVCAQVGNAEARFAINVGTGIGSNTVINRCRAGADVVIAASRVDKEWVAGVLIGEEECPCSVGIGCVVVPQDAISIDDIFDHITFDVDAHCLADDDGVPQLGCARSVEEASAT